MATAAWPNKKLALHKAYIKKLRALYKAEVLPLDFKDSRKAASSINMWVEKNTNGKIKSVVSPESLSNSLLLLTSTTYFKGGWEIKFDSKKTRNDFFYPARGSKVKIPFMHRQGNMNYYSEKTFQCISLPYTGRSYSMVVVLPKEMEGLASVEKILTGEKFSKILGDMQSVDVNLHLPKIQTRKRYSLREHLFKIGMKVALGTNADFSKLSYTPIRIEQVLHQTYLDVNEEYTEAAAATVITMHDTSLRQKPILFRADHPYLYFIVDNRTGMIAFMGRYMGK